MIALPSVKRKREVSLQVRGRNGCGRGKHLRGIASRLRMLRGDSSLSDSRGYREFCARAALDPVVFRSFRRHTTQYRDILEHVSPSLGDQYLKMALKQGLPSGTIAQLVGSDSVGSPETHPYPEVGRASPTTLRYIKVASDILRTTPHTFEGVIMEIGVGYGGQIRVLAQLLPNARFIAIDLPEVLSLARKFWTANSVAAQIESIPSYSRTNRGADIALSNYAFSELRGPEQERYWNQYIQFAPSGYFTYNAISPRSFQSWSGQHFADMVRGTVHTEEPLTHRGNTIILWGLLSRV